MNNPNWNISIVMKNAATLLALAAGLASATSAAQSPDNDRAARALIPLVEIAGVSPPTSAAATAPALSVEVQDACERARTQLEDGRVDEALTTLTVIEQHDGGDYYKVHYLKALAEIALGRLDDARESAVAAARLGYGVADVHYLLGQLLLRAGETDRAIAQFRTATLNADEDLNNVKVTLAWYALGYSLAEAGYDLAAARAYARFDDAAWRTHIEHRNAPETAALLSERPHGMVPERLAILVKLGRYDDALAVVDWAADIWPDDPQVLRWRVETLLAAGRADESYEYAREHMNAVAARDALLPIAVKAGAAAGRLEGWVEDAARRVRDGGDTAEALQLLPRLSDAGEPGLASRLGGALLERSPGDMDVTWLTAAALHAAGDTRGVVATLVGFVRANPDLREIPQRRMAEWMGWFADGSLTPELSNQIKSESEPDFAVDFVLGVGALAAGRRDEADEFFGKCLERRPGFAPARVAPAAALLASYEWEAVKKLAGQVLETNPDLASAHFLLAEAHDGLDENQQAEREYKHAVKLSPKEPLYKLALARLYKRLDNLRSAQRYYQSALADDPGSGEALEGLIDCYVRGDKVEVARELLKRVDQSRVPADSWRRVQTTMRHVSAPFGPAHIADLRAQFEQHPDDLATARMLAGGLYYVGRGDEARKVIDRVGGADSGDYHLLILLTNYYASRGEFERAVSIREKLLKRFPNRKAVLEPLALLYLYEFRVDEARAVWRRMMERAVDDSARVAYRDSLRDSYIQFGEFDEALCLVEESAKDDPEDDQALLAKAAIMVAAQRNDDAMELLRAYLAKAPAARDRRDMFYTYAMAAGAYDEIVKDARKWLDDVPDAADVANMLVTALLADNRPDDALKVAQEFTGTYSESLRRRIWLGLCEAAQGKTDVAVAEFDALFSERLMKSDVRREVRQHLISTLMDAGRYDEALSRCDAWIEQSGAADPQLKLEALLYKRAVLQVAGRDDEFAEVSELLLSYRPDNAGLLNDLGYTWIDAGKNIERATEMIRRAVAAEPLNAAYLDSLGWAYYKAGRFAEARKQLERAARLFEGRDAVIHDHLGDAAYRQGDQAAARESWRESLEFIKPDASGTIPERLVALESAVRAKLAALDKNEDPQTAPIASKPAGSSDGN